MFNNERVKRLEKPSPEVLKALENCRIAQEQLRVAQRAEKARKRLNAAIDKANKLDAESLEAIARASAAHDLVRRLREQIAAALPESERANYL